MNDPLIAFAIAEILAHGRLIDNHDARLRFFRGVIRLADQAPEIETLRAIVVQITECDDQLELIEQEQRKLALTQNAE